MDENLSNKLESERSELSDDINLITLSTLSDRKKYIDSIKFYFIFLFYGSFGGIIFNLIFEQYKGFKYILNFDLMINGIISPLVYYQSPRHILMQISKKQFVFIYTPFYIVGLCFRFLDNIPILNSFKIIPSSMNTTLDIVLACGLSLLIISICVYYILLSKFPLINFLLFIFYIVSLILASYYFYVLDGKIHYHHYIIGLTLMLLSRNSNSNIVLIIHAISYGIYIDGISRWGFAAIYSI